MSDVVVTESSADVLATVEQNIIIVKDLASTIVEVVAAGPQGAPGDVSGASSFFTIANRFYEISEDEQAKTLARTNLGLTTIDGGTFN